ncbi:OTUD4 [Symbiodinium sp. CCMP2592]|nr:OTUD4 [Symbiodinium sp. CCMP2592]
MSSEASPALSAHSEARSHLSSAVLLDAAVGRDDDRSGRRHQRSKYWRWNTDIAITATACFPDPAQAFENAAWEAVADNLRTRSRFRDVLGIGVATCVALACASEQTRASWAPVFLPRLVGVAVWIGGILPLTCVPGLQICFSPFVGVRAGEATNPGPKGSEGQSGFNIDVGSLLGPDFASSIRAFIEAAVQKAIKEALQGLSLGDKPEAETEQPGPKRRKHKHGKASEATPSDGTTVSPSAPAAQPARGSAEVKGKAKGAKGGDKATGNSPAAGTVGKGRGKDVTKSPEKGAGRGKGDGTKGQGQPRAADARAAHDWQTVDRRKPSAPWCLRSSDWNAPALDFSEVATALEKTTGVYKAVVLCGPGQADLLATLLLGSKRPHGVVAVTPDHPEAEARCPGAVGNQCVFKPVHFHHISSPGVDLPSPKVTAARTQKVVAAKTAVLYVRIYKKYVTKGAWKDVLASPQRAFHHWVAQHHMKVQDSWGWAKEQAHGEDHKVYAPEADVTAFVAMSGRDGIFINPPGGHAGWASASRERQIKPHYQDVDARACALKGINFFFRAAHTTDHDVVALPFADGEDTELMWCRWAPAEEEETTEGDAAMPQSASPAATQDATAAKEEKEVKRGAPSKGTGIAKRTCTETRDLPKGLEQQSAPTDGNCLFHAASSAIAHILKTTPEVHSVLRAKVAQHFKKHAERYELAWDKEMPDKKAATSFQAYISAMAEVGTWAGHLELAALGRIFDIKFVIFPRSPDLEVCAVHAQQRKRVAVLAFTGSHYEWLKPTGKLPQELCDVTTAPPKVPMRRGGGGKASSHASSAAASRRSVWTQASDGIEDNVSTWTSARLTVSSSKASVWTQGISAVDALANFMDSHCLQVCTVAEADINVGEEVAQILIAAFYGQSGNAPAASAQAEDILAICCHSQLPFIVAGDFNLEPTEAIVGEARARGVVNSLDDASNGAPLPATGPGRRRRIDYGLCHWSLAADAITNFEPAFSDHASVCYNIPLDVPAFHVGPRRRVMHEQPTRRLQPVAATFEQIDSTPFQQAIEAHDVDKAWEVMSDWAEACLSSATPGAVPRKSPWMPRRLEHQVHPAVHGSATVKTLAKLQRQIAVVAGTGDPQTAQKVVRSLPRARRLVPDLPWVRDSDFRDLGTFVDNRLLECQSQEAQAIRDQWKTLLREDTGRQRTFVKSRAEAQLEFEKRPPDADAAASAGPVHPSVVVREQTQAWIQKWQAEPQPRHEAIDQVLQKVPTIPRAELKLTFEAEGLKSLAAAMADKASGPDGWSGRDCSALAACLGSWHRADPLENGQGSPASKERRPGNKTNNPHPVDLESGGEIRCSSTPPVVT